MGNVQCGSDSRDEKGVWIDDHMIVWNFNQSKATIRRTMTTRLGIIRAARLCETASPTSRISAISDSFLLDYLGSNNDLLE